jgi:hypothetical protein
VLFGSDAAGDGHQVEELERLVGYTGGRGGKYLEVGFGGPAEGLWVLVLFGRRWEGKYLVAVATIGGGGFLLLWRHLEDVDS